eukprot:scaffold7142_cov171-Amphora_coffeaeformis.AAC.1
MALKVVQSMSDDNDSDTSSDQEGDNVETKVTSDLVEFFEYADEDEDEDEMGECTTCSEERPMKRLYACSDCLCVLYCSKPCQAKHWNTHHPVCPMFAQARERKLMDEYGYEYDDPHATANDGDGDYDGEYGDEYDDDDQSSFFDESEDEDDFSDEEEQDHSEGGSSCKDTDLEDNSVERRRMKNLSLEASNH